MWSIIWAGLCWLAGNMIVPVLIKVLEKVIPEMLTKHKPWGWAKKRKSRIVRKLKRYDARKMTLEEIADIGRRQDDLLRKADDPDLE